MSLLSRQACAAFKSPWARASFNSKRSPKVASRLPTSSDMACLYGLSRTAVALSSRCGGKFPARREARYLADALKGVAHFFKLFFFQAEDGIRDLPTATQAALTSTPSSGS